MVPIVGCIKNDKWTVHGCCRCGSPEHPYTQCVAADQDLPLPDLATAAMPARDPEERKQRNKWKKETYSVPKQTSWSSSRR